MSTKPVSLIFEGLFYHKGEDLYCLDHGVERNLSEALRRCEGFEYSISAWYSKPTVGEGDFPGLGICHRGEACPIDHVNGEDGLYHVSTPYGIVNHGPSGWTVGSQHPRLEYYLEGHEAMVSLRAPLEAILHDTVYGKGSEELLKKAAEVLAQLEGLKDEIER